MVESEATETETELSKDEFKTESEFKIVFKAFPLVPTSCSSEFKDLSAHEVESLVSFASLSCAGSNTIGF